MSFSLIKGPSQYFSGSKIDPHKTSRYTNIKIFDMEERKPLLKQRRFLLNISPEIGKNTTKLIFKHKRYYPNGSGYAGGRVNVYVQEARTTKENTVIRMLISEPVIRNNHLCNDLQFGRATEKIWDEQYRMSKIKKLPLMIYQGL